MEAKTWMMGDVFTLADCAAAPALFYANTVVPFGETEGRLKAYLDRLMARPSFARVLEEAQPYFALFPLERKPQIRGQRHGGGLSHGQRWTVQARLGRMHEVMAGHVERGYVPGVV